jgi:beta-galactosidase
MFETIRRIIYLTLLLCVMQVMQAGESDRKELFDRGWRFSLGNLENAHQAVYDDSSWRLLNLPHD